MSNRLDQQREKELTPKRFEYAMDKLNEIGIGTITMDSTSLKFDYKGNTITLFPYSGWFTGKGVKAGRGIEKLLAQLNKD